VSIEENNAAGPSLLGRSDQPGFGVSASCSVATSSRHGDPPQDVKVLAMFQGAFANLQEPIERQGRAGGVLDPWTMPVASARWLEARSRQQLGGIRMAVGSTSELSAQLVVEVIVRDLAQSLAFFIRRYPGLWEMES
jgi:hypothetical protein